MNANLTTSLQSAQDQLLRSRRHKLLCLAAGMLAGVLGQSALAADSATGPSNAEETGSESGGIREVVVTARRQDERLEKVPVAVVALSEADLTERRVTTESDLESATPGLTVRQTSSSNQLSFALRGQALDAFSYTSPTVLAYLDEFQTAGVTATAFYDLQSVQVLKGPQGTLFGRNATGGAILYETAKPTRELGGYLRAGYGRYTNREFEGVANVPLGDTAALRISGQAQKRDGFQHNVFLNLWENSVDSKNARVSLLLTPWDKFQNSTVVQYGKYQGYSGGLRLSTVYPLGATNNGIPLNTTAAALYPAGDPVGVAARDPRLAPFNGIVDFLRKQTQGGFYNFYNDTTSSHSADQKLAVNKTTYEFGPQLTLKNIVGYNKVISHDQTDVDGSPYQVLTIGVTGGPGAEGYTYDTKQFSEELQISGLLADSKLNYIVGGYYSRDDEGQNIPLNVGADYPGGTANVPLGAFRYNFQTQDRSKALYLQGSYELLSGLRATAGFRETWEETGIVHRHDSVPDDLNGSLLGVPNASVKTNKPSWTVGVDYQLTPEALVYIAHRGSWRTGGFNGTSSVPLRSGGFANNEFQPETTWDVEVGTKFAGHLGAVPARVNLAVYDQHVKDIQRAVYLGIAAQTSNANAARVTGVEFETQLELLRWLQVGASYAYTNARYTDPRATAVDTVGVLHNLILGPYGDTPAKSGSAYVRVAHQLPGNAGNAVARADMFAQSEFFYTNIAATLTPGTRIGGYTLVNLRLDWNEIFQSKFSASAYVRNLTDRQYEVGGLGLGAVIGLNSTLPGLPRIYGVDVEVKF